MTLQKDAEKHSIYWQNSSSEYIDDEGDYDAEELQGLIREAIDRLKFPT